MPAHTAAAPPDSVYQHLSSRTVCRLAAAHQSVRVRAVRSDERSWLRHVDVSLLGCSTYPEARLRRRSTCEVPTSLQTRRATAPRASALPCLSGRRKCVRASLLPTMPRAAIRVAQRWGAVIEGSGLAASGGET
eukprot:5955878-Pleurochrysis_carterae.AAC.2